VKMALSFKNASLRSAALLGFIVSVCFPAPSFAGGAAEARETARLNNCAPKKVEVLQQTIGADGTTIYRVSCTMSKTKDDSGAKAPDALLIKCDGTLCETLRPVSGEDK